MKQPKKQKMVDVHLEPDVIEMIDYVCKAEGMSREQVLQGLLERAMKAEQKTGSRT